MQLWYCSDDDYIFSCKAPCQGHDFCEMHFDGECTSPATTPIDGQALCDEHAGRKRRLLHIISEEE